MPAVFLIWALPTRRKENAWKGHDDLVPERLAGLPVRIRQTLACQIPSKGRASWSSAAWIRRPHAGWPPTGSAMSPASNVR